MKTRFSLINLVTLKTKIDKKIEARVIVLEHYLASW